MESAARGSGRLALPQLLRSPGSSTARRHHVVSSASGTEDCCGCDAAVQTMRDRWVAGAIAVATV
eukprot:9361195-Pyramimonas_sp.AAC.1